MRIQKEKQGYTVWTTKRMTDDKLDCIAWVATLREARAAIRKYEKGRGR